MFRKFSLLIFFTLTSVSIFGQITDIPIGDQTNIDMLYMGLYARWQGSTDSLAFQDRVSFRAAGRVTHTFNKTFSINAQAALQVENGSDLLPIIDYAYITQLTKKLQLRVGSFATPNTLLRPIPISWQGHTETYAQSRIIPGRPGGLLSYAFDEGKSLNVGYHYQNQQWASHAMLALSNIAFGGWVQNDGEFFGQIDYENEKVIANLNYSSIFDEWATTLFYNISPRYSLYTDVNYLVEQHDSDVLRVGGRAYFADESIFLGGFLALQYDFVTNLASAELLIHLN